MASPLPRIACLLVPDLPLAAELRANPDLRGRPVAVVSGPGPRADVLAVSPEAWEAGVRPWTTVVHAHALCSALVVRRASPALEQAARDAILDAALSASPRAEPAAPGAGPFAAEAAVYADARGVGALFGSERGFASALAERARRLGLPAVVAVASSRGTARIAARQAALQAARSAARSEPKASGVGPQAARQAARSAARSEAQPSGVGLRAARNETEIVVIPPGADAAFLAPLAVDYLDPDDDLADRLGRLGIRHIGELLRIPERALVSRFGHRIQALLSLARGEGRAPPPSAPAPARFEEAVDLEAPVERLEPLLFVLRGALARLAERLACRGLAAGDLDLALTLEGGGRDARRVGMAAPSLELRVWLRLVSLSLETRPPPAAIDGLRIATVGRPMRGDQLDFFRPAGPPPATLSRVLAELAALCGAERVGAPALADDHRPDAFSLSEFRPQQAARSAARSEPKPSEVGPQAARQAARSAARSEAQPSEVELRAARSEAQPSGVELRAARSEAQPSGVGQQTGRGAANEQPVLALRAMRPALPAQVHAPRGVPERVRSALANGRVLHCAGPWRTTGRWWSEGERYAFDHFDVQTEDGLAVRLRLDLVARRWQIDGVYD